jgi:predicted Zn-dependent protease
VDLHAEFERAEWLLDIGRPIDAADALVPVIAAEPGNAAVRSLLARAYFHSAQLNRAEQQLRWLIDHDPTDHYAQHVLGRTLERQGRTEKALPHLRMAAVMRPIDDYTAALRRVEAAHDGGRSSLEQPTKRVNRKQPEAT